MDFLNKTKDIPGPSIFPCRPMPVSKYLTIMCRWNQLPHVNLVIRYTGITNIKHPEKDNNSLVLYISRQICYQRTKY